MSQVLDYMTPTPPRVSRWPARFAFVLALYPLATVASLYLVWVAARLDLGRWPNPSLLGTGGPPDDPKFIGGWVHALYDIPVVMMLVAPVVALTHLAVTVWVLVRRRWDWLSTTVLCLLFGAWFGAFFLLYWDPLRVLDWYWD